MLTTAWERMAVALAMGAVGCTVLARRAGRLRGTTLAPPRRWAMGALSLVVASEVAVALLSGDGRQTWIDAIRYAAATATLCPIAALLGARRPQDRVWQMIVLSLWAILQVPNVQWLLVSSGQPLRVFPAWSWFLAVLLLVGLVNHLPTRFATAALLASAGQVVLLAGHLPLITRISGDWTSATAGPLAGIGLLVAAVLWAAYRGGQRTRQTVQPLDRLWLDFRDLYGAVWALRVAARVNASSAMHGWNITLTWNGFRARGDQREGADDDVITPKVVEAVERSLRSLLRRFVSLDWIDERLGRN